MIENIDLFFTTRNRKAELAFTINHMMNLGIKESQIYCVDDASSDGTPEWLQEKYPAINLYVNKESKGQIKNRNFLFSVSKRPYILSLDDDSHVLCREDLIEALSILHNNADYGIFNFHVFEQKIPPPAKKELPETVRFIKTFIACGCLLKREVIEVTGYYANEKLVFYGEELDCSIRAYQAGFYTVTKDNLVVQHRIDWAEREKQLKSNLAKGEYGAVWRSMLGFTSKLLIVSMFYPKGYDLVYLIRAIVHRFIYFVIRKKDYRGFFKGLFRFLIHIPFVIRNKNAMSYAVFKKWMKMSTF